MTVTAHGVANGQVADVSAVAPTLRTSPDTEKLEALVPDRVKTPAQPAGATLRVQMAVPAGSGVPE